MRYLALSFVAIATLSVLSLAAREAAPLLVAHAFFAVAALPLMFGAMLHFVPVLTRGIGPHRLIGGLPWLAAGAGVVALLGLAGRLPRPSIALAALVIAGAAGGLGIWILHRARTCLGAPHAGVRWYPAAIACLIVGMGAAIGMIVDPLGYGAWRRLHLHVNLFGWIGLTALGTLPVLLPTAQGKADPGAAHRLRTDLPWAAGGVALLAGAAAVRQPLVAMLGAVLLAGVLGRMVIAWLRGFGAAWRGPAVSLGAAACFMFALLGVGASHGLLGSPGAALAVAFAFGFLLPLVTGALAQLLPVWRHPGPMSPARSAFAAALARHAALRGLLFVAAGGLQLVAVLAESALAGTLAGVVAAAGMLGFAIDLARHWLPAATRAGL